MGNVIMVDRSAVFGQLTDILRRRIMILDGAMGTMIQSMGLSEEDFRGKRFAGHPADLKGNNDLLSITKPEVIAEIHRNYLNAGADITKTNTINANSISQSEYGLSDIAYEMNRTAALIARREADKAAEKTPHKPRFVAGVIGPTNRMLSISPDVNDPGKRAVTFGNLVNVYSDAAKGLIDGGADIILIETVFDTLNCKAAIFALLQLFRERGTALPVMISGTITDRGGRTLSGQTPLAFAYSVMHMDPLSIGLNCALGAAAMRPFLQELADNIWVPVSLHPNAGLPDAMGWYNDSPELMADILAEYGREGLLNIAGGCCGTTPQHIKAISEALQELPPRQIPERPDLTYLCGLEPLRIGPDSLFVNVGERTSVSGSAKFAKLIREGNYQSALGIARNQVENGAQIIDVNMDDPMIDAVSAMRTFMLLVASEPDICKVPVMIDSSRIEVIEAGLQCLQGKCIVNSISLKEGEKRFIELAERIKLYGAAIVVMAFDEKGQAESFERKVEILSRAYKLLTEKAGVSQYDIIFDPNVFALGTGMEEHRRFGIDFINAVKELKRRYPACLVSGGISNVSFSFRGNNTVREAINSVFLYHAINAGLDMGIVNPAQLAVYEEIEPGLRNLIEDLIFDRSDDATDRLLSYRPVSASVQSDAVPEKETWRNLSAAERLTHALIKGITDYIDTDIKELLEDFKDPVNIIEGPLMNGMNRVGDLFGNGKMFLPQVVKSARVMKQAVSLLTPVIEAKRHAEKDTGKSIMKGRIVLATVKGDVHDIGKNIVAIVLQCNGWEVIDLGVMVPADVIIEKAKEVNAYIIGLSGLISPSLDEMQLVAAEMERSGLEVPLLIGGAATSEIHTALKISPHYHGLVVHVKDASRAPSVCSSLLHLQLRRQFTATVKKKQNELRSRHEEIERKVKMVPIGEARLRRPAIDWKNYTPPVPSITGVPVSYEFTIDSLVPYINWSLFFHAWGMNAAYPDILSNQTTGDDARNLFEDAKKMLNRIACERLFTPCGVVGFYHASTTNYDDITLFTDRYSRNLIDTVFMLRQQVETSGKQQFLSLADFIAPYESGIKDYLGMFLVSAGKEVEEVAGTFSSTGDDYSAVLLRLIADRIAEAAAEYLHELVRKKLWGYAETESLSPYELFKGKYRGIRPAPGYPACPDHGVKKLIINLLDTGNKKGIKLTDSFAIDPPASICGFYFSHPQSCYFPITRIGVDQLEDYSRRTGVSVDETKRRCAIIVG